jgi:lysophospholipase L1-like esterase
MNPGAASTSTLNLAPLQGVLLTAAQIAAPTPDILAAATVIYQGPDGTLYKSDGVELAATAMTSASAGLQVGGAQNRYSAYGTIRYVSLPGLADFDGRSFRQIFQVPYRGACLVRATYETDDVTGGTITATAFAAGRRLLDDNPVNALGAAATWTVTSATTVSAASAAYATDGVYGSGKSGWALLDIPSPADTGAGGYVYVGTIAAAAPRRCIVGNASRPTSDWESTTNGMLTSMKYRAFYNGGSDNVTVNQNAFVNVSGPAYFNPCVALDVIPISQCVYGAFYGDSTTQGFGTGAPAIEPQSYAWGHVFCKQMRDLGSPLVMANYGMEGKTQTFYLQRLVIQLADADFTPAFVVVMPFSTNAGFTAPVVNAGIALAMTAAATGRRKGIRVIFATVPPNNSTDATTDGVRKAGNATIRNSGEPVLDISTLVSDGAAVERIRAGLTPDGTHFNVTGNDLIGTALTALYRTL